MFASAIIRLIHRVVHTCIDARELFRDCSSSVVALHDPSVSCQRIRCVSTVEEATFESAVHRLPTFKNDWTRPSGRAATKAWRRFYCSRECSTGARHPGTRPIRHPRAGVLALNYFAESFFF
jgi:hypothetical protein